MAAATCHKRRKRKNRKRYFFGDKEGTKTLSKKEIRCKWHSEIKITSGRKGCKFQTHIIQKTQPVTVYLYRIML
jgi:hypothetical protein